MIYIASPFSGEVERNIRYAKLCLKDSIDRGETPIAPHLIYPQVLDDNNEQERNLAMKMNLELVKIADLVAVYTDYGISRGMEKEIKQGNSLEYRKIFSVRETDRETNE